MVTLVKPQNNKFTLSVRFLSSVGKRNIFGGKKAKADATLLPG